MKIGELAKRSGLSTSRIRFYESAGLLQPAARQPNGYREYPSSSLPQLELIVGAQNAGFSLEEIRGLVPPDLSLWNPKKIVTGLQRKVVEIEELEQKLRQSKSLLIALIDEASQSPDGVACASSGPDKRSSCMGARASTP